MKSWMQKLAAVAVSGALAVGMTAALPVSYLASADADDDSDIILQEECENLTLLDGATLWTSIYDKQLPGYSGDGFVYLTNGTISVEVEVPEDGMYEITTRCAQILSEDGRSQTLSINGTEYMYNMPYMDTWTDFSFGIHRLQAGTNTIQILPKYGYASFDTLTIQKANLPDLDVSPTLSDANATSETQGLMNYLCDIYGEHMLSGQQEIYGGGHTEDSPNGYNPPLGYESEFEWINDNFGDYPAIRGFDMMNYNPLYGWDDGTTERIIDWGEKNGIPTLCWHINVPKDFSSYELGDAVDWSKCTYKPDETDFDTANAVIEGTKEYEYVMLTIEKLAEQLQKVQDAGIPIIFRPYHEAEGNSNTDGSGSWFWWGKSGAEVYKALWQQLYTTLTEEYGIHNLIWEYNSYDYSTSAAWYPGDDWVDIVGYDKYNCVYNRHDGKTSGPNEDAISSTFYELVNLTNGKKLVSMPENDTVPSLDNILVEKANWLYFCIWYDNGQDNFLSGSDKNDPETLKEMYQSDYCITLSELPDWKNYESTKTGTSTEPTDPTDPTEPTEPTETVLVGDLDGSGSINVIDLLLLKRYWLNGVETEDTTVSVTELDWNGDSSFDVADVVALTKFLLQKD